MKVRKRMLWKVPAFCLAASWLSYYLTIYLGHFVFVVMETGADGTVRVSVDPLRSFLFHGVLLLAIVLAGGLWFFRGMTRKEIALSAGILTAMYLAVTLAELVPGFPLEWSVRLVPFYNWTAPLSSLLFRLTGQLTLSAVLTDFMPLLFPIFGKKPEE